MDDSHRTAEDSATSNAAAADPQSTAGEPSSPAVWYADGLAFQCTQCGNCCTGGPGFVWVTDDEIRAIAEHRQTTFGEILIHHTRFVRNQRSLTEFANGDCTFLDPQTRRCTIYAARPVQCRTWPFWRSHLESPTAWNRVGLTCPGINRGELVPLQQIEDQARQRDAL